MFGWTKHFGAALNDVMASQLVSDMSIIEEYVIANSYMTLYTREVE